MGSNDLYFMEVHKNLVNLVHQIYFYLIIFLRNIIRKKYWSGNTTVLRATSEKYWFYHLCQNAKIFKIWSPVCLLSLSNNNFMFGCLNRPETDFALLLISIAIKSNFSICVLLEIYLGLHKI